MAFSMCSYIFLKSSVVKLWPSVRLFNTALTSRITKKRQLYVSIYSATYIFSTCFKEFSAVGNKRMNSLDIIITKLKKLAPLSLAGSWDNVGLLVEPSPPKFISKVMLTNDLTSLVMEEAKDKTVDLIISYHPPIFAPLKRLSQSTWKERLVVECMENRIAVFSPHTSYDAVEGGVNDWLLSAFEVDKKTVSPIEPTQEFQDGNTRVLEIYLDPSKLKEIRDESLVLHLPADSRLRKNKEVFSLHSVKPGSMTATEQLRLRVECNEAELLHMVKGLITSGCKEKYTVSQLAKGPRPAVGMGRKAHLVAPITIEEAITKVKGHLGVKHVSVARAPGKQENEIGTVAVCAGSGSSVLRGVSADLLVTGEMSHHEVLDAVHCGSSIILCQHSNSERGYLKVLKNKLSTLLGTGVEVFISETDKDPLEVD